MVHHESPQITTDPSMMVLRCCYDSLWSTTIHQTVVNRGQNGALTGNLNCFPMSLKVQDNESQQYLKWQSRFTAVHEWKPWLKTSFPSVKTKSFDRIDFIPTYCNLYLLLCKLRVTHYLHLSIMDKNACFIKTAHACKRASQLFVYCWKNR